MVGQVRKQTVRVACLVVLSAACLGCIWDSDTLAHEAKGIPNVIAVTTGRFERNPPLYYEMRLGRATRQIAQNSADLAAYDDSGASCDRLGRGDEAIRWMERKRQAMDQAGEPANSEHRYRYLANVGTFWAHRWFRNGADRSRIGEMKRAAETIRKAIAMNPNAHFGREKYQLMAMDWIINAPSWEQRSSGNNFLTYYRWDDTVKRAREVDYDEASRGISGLIAL